MATKDDGPAARPGFLKREWLRILLSLGPTLILGTGGMALLWWSTCWNDIDPTAEWWGGPNNCAAHSSVGIAVAYVLSWPYIVTRICWRQLESRLGVWTSMPDRAGFVMLWLYYYLLVRLGESIEMRIRRKLSG